jgi:hypothetical protein
MNKGGKELKGLTLLNAPVPPMLAKIFGYYGDARYVAFNWTPYGNEVEYSDGQIHTSKDAVGFLHYINHPAVSPLLEEYELGNSETEAEHALILDTERQEVYIAPVREVETFLSGQWPPHPMRMGQEEHVPKIAIAVKGRGQPRDIEEIRRRIAEQSELNTTMLQWLDKQLKN